MLYSLPDINCISLCSPVKPFIKMKEYVVKSFGRFINMMRFQKQRTQSRGKRQSNKCRYQDRNSYCDGKLLIQLADNAGQKTCRDKYSSKYKGNGNNRS